MLVIGDLRAELEKDLKRSLEKVINQNVKKNIYWILVFSKMEKLDGLKATREPREGETLINATTIITTKLVLLSRRPPRMLGTTCYYVDNRAGRLTRLWTLPLDYPRLDEQVSENAVWEIFESAQGMPVVH